MIQIKPVAPADIPLLRHIAIQSYRDHYLHLWHDEGDWYIKKCFTLTTLEEEYNNPNSRFFLLYWDNEPAGFLKINMHAALGEITAAEGLELERIYLTKAAKGKGIGKQAIDLTAAIAIQQHKKVIWLKAMDSSKDAIAFYEKMGFQLCGTHYLNFEPMKKEYRGMVVMKKEIIPGFHFKEG